MGELRKVHNSLAGDETNLRYSGTFLSCGVVGVGDGGVRTVVASLILSYLWKHTPHKASSFTLNVHREVSSLHFQCVKGVVGHLAN